MSGVISPTNLSLFSSSPSGGGNGVNNQSPRTITPNQQHHSNQQRSNGGSNNTSNQQQQQQQQQQQSVSRWNTGSFIALDDNMDYGMMSPLISSGGNQGVDQQGGPNGPGSLMDDGIQYLASRPHSPTRLAP
jgi:hypothetical protein